MAAANHRRLPADLAYVTWDFLVSGFCRRFLIYCRAIAGDRAATVAVNDLMICRCCGGAYAGSLKEGPVIYYPRRACRAPGAASRY